MKFWLMNVLSLFRRYRNTRDALCEYKLRKALGEKVVGEVLKHNKQKMDEGEALIKYFSCPCKPTAANGERTRNLPKHAPDKWRVFKEYNKRDVEVETVIQQRLARFPVPGFVWEEYYLDQEINDRGIEIDRVLQKMQ